MQDTSLAFENNINPFDSGNILDLTCDDILNRIVKPRQWKKDDVDWKQTISKQPATKSDVKKLGVKLDTYLRQFKAQDVGICPIKRELYSQCFNEIIRQVTLNCVERGYLMVTVRDEIKITIDAYKALYESGIAYGIRKALLQKKKKSDLIKMAELLKMENQILEAELQETINMTAEIEQKLAEKHELEVKTHEDRLNVLKNANHLLKVQLETIISPKKRL